VTEVSARRIADPSLLKPNPYFLNEALTLLDTPAASTVFVGDSVSDIDAAYTAGMMFVGFANKPGKAGDFFSFSPDATITVVSHLSKINGIF
jgi:phosphoglycolate phosphatase-like HAD superfamily hydrolase